MRPTVVCLGAVILDVLGRPCLELPPGQTGQRISQIRLTAAGTAAGTAVDLAKLDTDVVLVGTIGQDDAGEFLLSLFARYDINTVHLRRTDAAQTSASMLPIRPNGDRGAYHVVGANAHFELSVDERRVAFAAAEHLHVGGPESMGDFVTEGLVATLRDAREAGLTTSLDVLASSFADEARAALREAMQWVDYFMPNDQQICELYGADDVDIAATGALADGARTVVVACGPEGCLLAHADHRIRIPAADVEVVDTTGCGDALSAAFIRAKLLGWEDEAAARLGCTAGGLVATSLGSDAGIIDLPSLLNRDRDHLNA